MKWIFTATFVMTLSLSVQAEAEEEYAFTVDLGKPVKENESCRPFKNLKNKSVNGEPFEKWCLKRGGSVFICSGIEKFYILKFPDLASCSEVLDIMKSHLAK